MVSVGNSKRVPPGVKPFLIEPREVEDKKRGQLDDVNLLRVRSRSLALLAIELVDPLKVEE